MQKHFSGFSESCQWKWTPDTGIIQNLYSYLLFSLVNSLHCRIGIVFFLCATVAPYSQGQLAENNQLNPIRKPLYQQRNNQSANLINSTTGSKTCFPKNTKRIEQTKDMPNPNTVFTEESGTAVGLKMKLDKESRKNLKDKEDDSLTSHEVIRPFDERVDRQEIPVDLVSSPSGGLLASITTAILLTPMLIANLIMTIITFGLNVSIRTDSRRLTELRKEQLNVFARVAGIPLALVNPNSDPTLLERQDQFRSTRDMESSEMRY